jgi:hypothetical protein
METQYGMATRKQRIPPIHKQFYIQIETQLSRNLRTTYKLCLNRPVCTNFFLYKQKYSMSDSYLHSQSNCSIGSNLLSSGFHMKALRPQGG